jgi:hypothetical protein
MKKIACIVLAIALTLALMAGCGVANDNPEPFAGGDTGSNGANGSAVPPPASESHGFDPEAPSDSALYGRTEDDGGFLGGGDYWGEPGELGRGSESGQNQSEYIRQGLLTAGEWNDNENHAFLVNLMQSNSDYRTFERMWQFNLAGQFKAAVTDNGAPVNNVKVELLNAAGQVIYSAQTNNMGIAYLFEDYRNHGKAASIRAGGTTQDINLSAAVYEFTEAGRQSPKRLDLMFVIDTTGSMGDELEYLKVELYDIVRQVTRIHPDVDIRLSVNVYRDFGDEYVVRPMPFERDIDNQLNFLKAQVADGGGDWEEAVHMALADALEDHDWRDDATARLLFLVADAPPHNTDEIRDEMHRLTMLSSEMGVRIVPVASSGIDKVTEFLFRALAASTGGTYVFLTGHSGIGSGHIEPTIGDYTVELLNELLVSVIGRYLNE